MIPLPFIEKNSPKIDLSLKKRGITDGKLRLATIKKLNKKRKNLQKSIENLTHELKNRRDMIVQNKGALDQISAIKTQIVELKKRQKEYMVELKACQTDLNEKIAQIPNLPLEGVPIGQSAKENVVTKRTPLHPPAIEKCLPHWDLVKQYDLVDFEQGIKIAGAGFPVYKGKGAKLQRALINFFLDVAQQKGYLEVATPLLANQETTFGTGQLPDKEKMLYTLADEPLYLIPTAEVTITNLYRDSLLKKEELPIKLVGYTPCFRREAGSWGRHVRGLNRLHQFDKVEIVQIVTPDQYEATLQEMCAHVEQLLQDLGLSYRIVQLCTGDLGFTAAITYDFEVWSPGQAQWLEVSSVSCFTTYQSTRMHLRYTEGKEKAYCYTLNGSALALPRIISALLEQHQTPSAIHLPTVLHPYTKFKTI